MMMMMMMMMMMIIYAATASQADPSPHQIIQRLFMNPPSLSPPTARGYELCHPHHLAGR